MARCLPSGPLTSRMEKRPSTLTGRTVNVAVASRDISTRMQSCSNAPGPKAALHVVADQHELLDAVLLKARQDIATDADRLPSSCLTLSVSSVVVGIALLHLQLDVVERDALGRGVGCGSAQALAAAARSARAADSRQRKRRIWRYRRSLWHADDLVIVHVVGLEVIQHAAVGAAHGRLGRGHVKLARHFVQPRLK